VCRTKPANAPIGRAGESALSTPANAPIRVAGRVSSCAAWQKIIQSKQEQQLSARRIHQHLVSEHGASVSNVSVRRFLRKLGRTKPLPFRRLESLPMDNYLPRTQ